MFTEPPRLWCDHSPLVHDIHYLLLECAASNIRHIYHKMTVPSTGLLLLLCIILVDHFGMMFLFCFFFLIFWIVFILIVYEVSVLSKKLVFAFVFYFAYIIFLFMLFSFLLQFWLFFFFFDFRWKAFINEYTFLRD